MAEPGRRRWPCPLPPSVCHLYIMSLWLYTWPYIQTQVRKCVFLCVCVYLRGAESKTKGLKKQNKNATTSRCEGTRNAKKHDDVRQALPGHNAGSMYK